MTDRQELYDELLPLLDQASGDPIRDRPGAAKDGRVWSFCPAHPDGSKSHRRSLSLSPQYGLDCFAGCEFQTIVRALRERSGGNITQFRPRDAIIPGSSGPVKARNANQYAGKLTGEYVYRLPDGTPVAVKGRFERSADDKSFSWRVPGSSDWHSGLGGLKVADVPLWNADKIAAIPDGSTIWITEGEKDLGALEQRLDAKTEVATTHPGGASTRDFGPWPERLFAGRKFHFRTWADNDDTGREFMARWRQVIAPYAVSIAGVNVDVKHKGGAFDYFAAGGTIEAVRENKPTKPIVQYGSGGSIRVSIPTADGQIVHFTFSQIEKSTRSLDSELQVDLEAGQPVDEIPFTQRINVLSGSQVTDLRRTVEAVFGKSYDWPKTLNKAIALMRQAFAQVDRSRDASEAEDMPLERGWFVDKYIPAASLIGVFGDGESAKTMTMIRMALSAVLGEDFLPGMAALQGVGLYGDWETNFEDWGRRVRRVVRGMGYPQMPPGLLHYWPGAQSGTPIYDQIDAIIEACLKYRVTFFICDSLGFACGTEPERAESAIKTYNALNRLVDLGVSVFGLGHINRADAEKAGRGGALRMYGNIFWTNGPRHTLFVKRSTGDNDDTIFQGWYPRKWNNGKRPQMLTIKVDFEGEHGPITFTRQEQKIPDLEAVRGLRARLWELLKTDAKSIAVLSEELESETVEVEKALKGARIGPTKAKAFTSFDREGIIVWARAANS